MNDIKFVHVRPWNTQRGGLTLAYTLPVRKGDKMIHVAVAQCSDQDTFCKKVGRTLALKKYIHGETIQIATDRKLGLGYQLKRAFLPIAKLGIRDYDEFGGI